MAVLCIHHYFSILEFRKYISVPTTVTPAYHCLADLRANMVRDSAGFSQTLYGPICQTGLVEGHLNGLVIKPQKEPISGGCVQGPHGALPH